MTPVSILWIYIILLVAGGLAGFLKAGSKMSLLMSLAFAAALSLCAIRVLRPILLADILLLFLLIFFGWRFAKGRKFMPAGLMTLLTVVALALRHLL
jgi:uncharacterized membrane protein (UPF0136 family)